MLKLYISRNSPYARRARIAAREAGLMDRVEEISVSSVEQLAGLGAGGKIPILITDSGASLCESLIITRYLNDLAGGTLLPSDPASRLACLALESTASVLMDSMFARAMENLYKEEALRSETVLQREIERARRCYDALEDMLENQGEAVSLASIAVVSSLGYANWRHPDDDWRKGRAKLSAYYDHMMTRSAFAETAPEL